MRKAGSKGPYGPPREAQGKLAPGREPPRSSLCPGSRVPSKAVCTCSQTPPIQALPLPKSLDSGQPQVQG